jgi:hypothetical protein
LPGSILDVRTAAGSGPFLTLVNTSATANTNVIETSYTLNNANTGSATAAVIGVINPGATGNTYGDIYFKTTNPTSGLVERMRIGSDGNLLVGGTSNALGARAIFENAAGNQIGVRYTGIATYYLNADSGGSLAFSKDGTERMRLTPDGYFLVGGTTTGLGAAGRGVIEASGSGSAILGLSTGGATAGYVYHDGTGMSVWQQLNSYMAFGTNGLERMRITAIGDLLVGTTATSGRVTLGNNTGGANGFVAIQTEAGGYNFLSKATSNGGTYYHAEFQQTGTSVGSITSSGSTTAYNTSSDYRLKDIDGPIANSGAYIDALKPVQGSWKADGSRFIGLLAHEAQEVSETQIATGEKDGEEMQAMDYSAPEIIANLIAEIQSLRARVAQLEGN